MIRKRTGYDFIHAVLWFILSSLWMSCLFFEKTETWSQSEKALTLGKEEQCARCIVLAAIKAVIMAEALRIVFQFLGLIVDLLFLSVWIHTSYLTFHKGSASVDIALWALITEPSHIWSELSETRRPAEIFFPVLTCNKMMSFISTACYPNSAWYVSLYQVRMWKKVPARTFERLEWSVKYTVVQIHEQLL